MCKTTQYNTGGNTMTKQWVEETENLIQSIERERDIIAQDHDKLGKELAAKDSELTHWRAVLESYQNRQLIEQPSLFLQDSADYKNLSERDILLWVRDQNKGYIPMKQAAELFKKKVKTPTHAASAAYSVLKRLLKQGKVVKVKPGLYRWANGSS
jgi:hypothetical protein